MTVFTTDPASDRLDDDGASASPQPRASTDGLRLLWAPVPASGDIDGAWWPRSRDAEAELRVLLPLASERMGGPVTRVSLNMDAWAPDQPRRMLLAGRLVRLGWFRTLDPATVTVGRGTYDRLTLLLLPADLDAAAGVDLMQRLSATARWPLTTEAALTGDWRSEGSEQPA
jgi:hypothetical protein